MEFIFLILINTVMAVIFYLVIRLKLEKTATGYREKKLKKEIDEVISEFNEAAERNISILESRIAVMKKLLSKSGDLKSVDIRIDDDGSRDAGFMATKKHDVTVEAKSIRDSLITEERASPASRADQSGTETAPLEVKINYIELIMNKLNLFRNTFIEKFNDYRGAIINFCKTNLFKAKSEENIEGMIPEKEYKDEEAMTVPAYEEPKENKEHRSTAQAIQLSIEKDFKTGLESQEAYISGSETADKAVEEKRDDKLDIEEEEGQDLTESEISSMFDNSKDKYSLITELHEKGYSAGILTRCSGLPIGEVNLVLDLSDSV